MSIRGGLSVALLCLACLSSHGAQTPLDQQRTNFELALGHLSAGRVDRFRALERTLRDYPLYPYLQYAQLERQLPKVNAREVAEWLERNDDSPLALRLRAKWLRALAASAQWRAYLDAWNETASDTVFLCWRMQALLNTGAAEQAYSLAPGIWETGRSLPADCTAPLDKWIAARGVPDALSWKRMLLALERNDLNVATFAQKALAPASRTNGQLLIDVHRNPHQLSRGQWPQDERTLQIITYGISRLTKTDPRQAWVLWQSFQRSHAFNTADSAVVTLGLLEALADADQLQDVPALPLSVGADHAGAVEAVLRWSIRHRRWSELVEALRDLPLDVSSEPRWRYWLARGMELSAGAAPRSIASEVTANEAPFVKVLRDVATDRSYYGFLAADRLGLQPNLAQQDAPRDPKLLAEVEKLPALRRALELFALGRQSDARSEWLYLLKRQDAPRQLAAGVIAARWGWYQMAIQTVIETKAWDILELRFPTAYKDVLVPQATAQSLDPSWVFAIARQESAFKADARSPAGALGLMQLMPATGKEVARRVGVRLGSNADLLRPELNARLGSNYLAEMYTRFASHRALASAAYNAGPSRVRKWMAALPPSPLDIWVESIPFNETRRYVQNVLMYSHIYSRMLGTDQPFLYEHER